MLSATRLLVIAFCEQFDEALITLQSPHKTRSKVRARDDSFWVKTSNIMHLKSDVCSAFICSRL